MTVRPKLRIGVVGVGFGAQVQIPGFQSEGLKVVAVCSKRVNWLAHGIVGGNQEIRREITKGKFEDTNIREAVKIDLGCR